MTRPLLTERDTASLRAVHAMARTDVCAITSPVIVTDLVKGEIRSWPAVTQTVPCAQLSRASALARGYVIDDNATEKKAILMVGVDVAVHKDDRIVRNANGIVWEVSQAPQDPGTYGTAVYLECTEAGS